MSKAILNFSILIDHADKDTEIRSDIKLYREDDGLIWRIGGEFGDPVEVLPRPSSIAEAKADVRATYGRDGAGVWKVRAAWL